MRDMLGRRHQSNAYFVSAQLGGHLSLETGKQQMCERQGEGGRGKDCLRSRCQSEPPLIPQVASRAREPGKAVERGHLAVSKSVRG